MIFSKIAKKISLTMGCVALLLLANVSLGPTHASARSQRAIVADMCETAIASAKANGDQATAAQISGVDENGNPLTIPGNRLCSGEYATLSSDEVTDLVNEGLCDALVEYTTEALCSEYDSWIDGGGDTPQDQKDDSKAKKDRKNSLQGPIDTICNILKTDNPGLYNSAAFCTEQASSAVKESSLQSFCNQYNANAENGDSIKNACEEAFQKGYINKEFNANNESQTPKDLDCQNGGVMGWILCPVFELGANVTSDAFESVIRPMLENIPVSTQKKDPFYKAWSNFRMLGNIVLVGAMMVLVYGQIRGGGR